MVISTLNCNWDDEEGVYTNKILREIAAINHSNIVLAAGVRLRVTREPINMAIRARTIVISKARVAME